MERQNAGTSSGLVLKAIGWVPGSKTRPARFYSELTLRSSLLCVAYYFGSLLGYALLFPSSYISVIWPPNTVLLVALLLSPPRQWLWLLLIVFPVHLLAQAQSGASLWAAGLYYAYDCVLVLVTAAAIHRAGLSNLALSDLRQTLTFIAVTTIAVAVGSLVWSPLIVGLWFGGDLWTAWYLTSLSNLLPFLIATPGLVIACTRGADMLRKASLARYTEFAFLALGLLACGIVIFGLKPQVVGKLPALLYAPLPFLLWAAVRFGPGGLSLSCLIFALLAIFSAVAGHGPFVTQSAADNVLWLQIFLLAVYLPLLVLASVVEERRTKEQALKESEERFHNMADNAPVMVWVSDPNRSSSFVSKSWYEFTGQTPETGLGFGWLNAVHPDDRAYAHDSFFAANEEREPVNLEYRLRRHDGEYRWVIDSAAPRFGSQGDFVGYIGSVLDISERRGVESRLNTQYAITRILSEAASMTEAAPRVLQTICEQLDCEYAEIWRVDRDVNALICIETWHLPLKPLTEFESSSRPFVFPLGVGLPGRVWLTKKPLCLPDVTVDADFLRAKAAATARLRGALGFPILVGDDVLGVIVLFTCEIREPDEERLKMIISIGSQIGQFIERKAAEQKNNQLLYNLGERIKELTALHRAARILQDEEQPMPDLLQQFVDVLPPAWQFPEIAGARVCFGNLEFATPNFRGTSWIQRANFSVEEGVKGSIEVVYVKERPTESEGPFLAEERNLIDSLAELLRAALERRRSAEMLRKNETVLRASYDRIQDLAGRLITAQEVERSRIAGELHDDVNQQLAGLSIALSNVKRQLQNGGGGATVHEEIGRLQQRAIDLSGVIRGLSHKLHPGILRHAGLVAALRGHCAEFGRQHAIEVTLSAADAADIIPDDVALCLYRVVQEALRNCAEHSCAHRAQVTLSSTEDVLELTIADDGQGFDLAEAQRLGGLGLISLDERVRVLGGSLTINTALNRGTEMRVQVPVKQLVTQVNSENFRW